MKLIDYCPRCRTDRKYERDQSPKFGCWSWWHQYVTLERAFPEWSTIASFKPVSTPTIERPHA